METFGNISLLDRHRIGFLAGSKIAALSVLPTLDWASEVAAREDVSVLSGFHSQLERQVLDFLLRGKCGIVCVLARSLYSKIPPIYKQPFSNGRLLFITKEKQDRPTKESAFRRNQLIVSLADELVAPYISPDSSISTILSVYDKPTMTL